MAAEASQSCNSVICAVVGVCVTENPREAELRKDEQLGWVFFHPAACTCIFVLAVKLKPSYNHVAISKTPAGAVTWWPGLGLRDHHQFLAFSSFSLF